MMTDDPKDTVSLSKKIKKQQNLYKSTNTEKSCCIAEAASELCDNAIPDCCIAEAASHTGHGSCCIAEAATDLSCFIATSSLNINPDEPTQKYTYENHPDLVALRRFRDQKLKKTRAGRAFIKYYYHFGPTLAGIIRAHPALRLATRYLLVKPFATLSRWTTR